MVNHGTIKSTVKPNALIIDDYNVWVNSNIIEITESIDSEYGFVGYQYDCVQYDKDEYIKVLSEQNKSVEQQLTNTQLAIVEVYESVVL